MGDSVQEFVVRICCIIIIIIIIIVVFCLSSHCCVLFVMRILFEFFDLEQCGVHQGFLPLNFPIGLMSLMLRFEKNHPCWTSSQGILHEVPIEEPIEAPRSFDCQDLVICCGCQDLVKLPCMFH